MSAGSHTNACKAHSNMAQWQLTSSPISNKTVSHYERHDVALPSLLCCPQAYGRQDEADRGLHRARFELYKVLGHLQSALGEGAADIAKSFGKVERVVCLMRQVMAAVEQVDAPTLEVKLQGYKGRVQGVKLACLGDLSYVLFSPPCGCE